MVHHTDGSLAGGSWKDFAQYWDVIPFLSIHTDMPHGLSNRVDGNGFSLAVGSYYLRMIAVTAGSTRYFSHRSFKTSRVFQFILAFLAMTSAQKGVLWWAAHHRHHHNTRIRKKMCIPR